MNKVEQPEVTDLQNAVRIVVALANLKPFAMGDLTEAETRAIDWIANVYQVGRGGKHDA